MTIDENADSFHTLEAAMTLMRTDPKVFELMYYECTLYNSQENDVYFELCV